VLRPLVAADMQDVAIALGRDQAALGAVMLEHGVGCDRVPWNRWSIVLASTAA